MRTGFYGRRIEIENFIYYKREDFFKVLEQGKAINNNIFQDFYLNQKQQLEVVNSFRAKLFDNWESSDWQGLFIHLHNCEELEDSQ